MKTLNYSDALILAKKLATELAEKRELAEHCKENNLNYHNVFTFIRVAKRKKKQPKLIADFLKSMGYTTSMEKQIIYTFIVDTDESSRLFIDNILLEEKEISKKEASSEEEK